jgi:2'-5' RNA ligase
MSDQLPLGLAPPGPAPDARNDGLYLFLRPDAAALDAIGRVANDLRARHRLSGKPQARDRLHVTMLHIGHYAGLPPEIVDKARAAAGAIRAAPFAVMFDEAVTFNTSLAVVLRSSDDLMALAVLRDQAYRAMRDVGLRPRNVIANPHITLLRDLHVLAPERVEPVRWTVREFSLVHSLVGQGRHVELGRWTLQA